MVARGRVPALPQRPRARAPPRGVGRPPLCLGQHTCPEPQNQLAEETGFKPTHSILTQGQGPAPPSAHLPRHPGEARSAPCPYLTPIVNMLSSCFPCSQPVNMIKPGEETRSVCTHTRTHTCAHAYVLGHANVFPTHSLKSFRNRCIRRRVRTSSIVTTLLFLFKTFHTCKKEWFHFLRQGPSQFKKETISQLVPLGLFANVYR